MTHFQQVLHEGGTIGDLKRRRDNYSELEVKKALEAAIVKVIVKQVEKLKKHDTRKTKI